MKNLKFYPLLLALTSACGTSDQTSSTKTVTGGRGIGSFSSWITTGTNTKFEESGRWALEGGMTYFPELGWEPASDIFWTYDSSRVRTTRDEVKTRDLQKDTGPSAILLADAFRYFPIDSFPSPIWSMSTAGVISSGLFLIDNFGNLDESRNLLDEIHFKTFVRMQGQNSSGSLITNVIAVCSGQEAVNYEGGTVLMPKTLFTETMSTSKLVPEALNANEWKYFKAEVLVREGLYQVQADRCRAEQGELVGYLDIGLQGTGTTKAQFLTIEMITVGGDE